MSKHIVRNSVVIFFLLLVHSSFGVEIRLPKELNHWNIHHIRVEQLPVWSCGYNALYNAANLERHFEIPKKSTLMVADYKIFKDICMRYLNVRKLQPGDSSDQKIISTLATQLGLETNRGINRKYAGSNGVANIIDYFDVLGLGHSSKKHNENKRKQERTIDEVSRYLSRKQGLSVVHFFCIVQSRNTGHALLVSLVKFSKNKYAVYIFDNLNEPITDKSDIYGFLQALYKKGLVSKYQQVASMPRAWPGFPRRF